MSKQRYINTKFWDDNYIINLDPTEKLLFIYFLTNPLTTICGIYEITLRRIAFDTGIEKEMVDKIIKRFSRDSKIYHVDGWLFIKNFEKHQSVNPKIEIGIEKCKNDVPKPILEKIDRLCIAYDSLSKPTNYINTNSNININSNSNNIAAIAAGTEVMADLLKDKNRHIQIIGLFAKAKKITFTGKQHQSVFIRRNLRSAKNLISYKNEKIIATMQYLIDNADYKWTLETVEKYIDEDLCEINKHKIIKL